MIPAQFEYTRPSSLDEAIGALAEGGEDAKLLAGGHSLLPLMKLRLAVPTLLVDLQAVPGLHGIARENGSFRLGAMTTHAELEHAPELGLLSKVAATIADPQVRHRGTLGGSLAHGDPASDELAVMLATEATMTVQGAGGAQRTVAAEEFFLDYLTTALEPGEVMTEIRMPALDGYGFGYQKFNRRQEDWAMAAVCAAVSVQDGVVADVRVGLTHMASTPLRARAVEDALRGQPLTRESVAAAAQHADEGTDPPGDLNATPEYKRHLARVLCRRALAEAGGL